MRSIIDQILLENAETFAQRNEIANLTEAQKEMVDNTMVANLYQSAIDHSHVDYDTIPQSAGDLTKYIGYKSMTQSIAALRDISAKGKVKIDELDILDQAIANLVTYRDAFERGFKLNKEFVMMTYNSLVYCAVESTSAIISSYVDFAKRVDKVEFEVLRGKERNGLSSLATLAQFNLSVRNGDFSKVLNAVNSSGSEQLVGSTAIYLTAAVLTAAAAVIPLTREAIYLTYYSRMRLSDYLAQQATLIEAHRDVVEAGSAPAAKRKEILQRQSRRVAQLRSMSDRIKVDRASAERTASASMKKENKTWTLGNVQQQAATNANNGYQLL